MEIIKQTNRTILFEEINPQKLDLITLIGDVNGYESLSDEKLIEINEHLLVRDFDEFLKKFEPKVYSFYNAATQKVAYTLEKPEGIPDDAISEIPLDENNDFLKMLFTLIDAKKNQGIKNVDFKFENILEMISPKKVMEDIKQIRKEISYLHSKYEELDDNDPTKGEMGDKLNIKFEEASKHYNNIMGMLPIAIEDIKTRLLLGQKQEDTQAEAIKVGILTMGEQGELKILEAPKAEGNALVVKDQENANKLIEVFEEDYKEITENPTTYVQDLVIRTFAPMPVVQEEINVEQEVENYNTYLEFFKNSKDEFVKTAKPLIEKLLGVKMFFEQYETKNKAMKPSLLVTNTKVDMIVKSNNKDRFLKYLNTINAKNDFNDTIWFGIVPAIEFDSSVKREVRRERFKGSKKEVKSKGNTMESLTQILNIAKDYKIQIFFNFEAKEETTFSSMATLGVERYINKCEPLTKQEYSEFAIPCLPNFTVIPRDKSGVVLDSRLKLNDDGGVELSKEKEDIMKLWLEGIYIDASYVAAGLVASYQCPEYLKTKFKNTATKYPGVRFDLEEGDNGLKVLTTLAKEISGFTNKIKDEINRKNFGFIFSSENAQVDGRLVKRITVYKARSLAQSEEGFEPIFKTTVSTYIERMLRFHTNDFKQDKLIKFFSNNPKSQKSIWVNDSGYINSILKSGDSISNTIDEQNNVCQIELAFNGSVKNLEIFITKSTSA
ncbi:MAG: hypothetical protein PWP46_2125 [Fusobacteriaceae bacterium]|nr:hypothetical protein [Fusobacteriaceae bacterium]